MAPAPAQALSAAALLDAAAVCRSRPAQDGCLYLAALARPDLSFTQCAALPIGTRDEALAALREATFGPELALRATCPGCAEATDVDTTTEALRVVEREARQAEVQIGGLAFGIRPLDTADLAAAAGIVDPEAAREALARRCLVARGEAAVPDRLDSAEIEAAAAALATIDPGADPYVAMTCFACGEAWTAPIDVARLLAADIAAAADTLIDDVHDLAAAYHWSEEAILALPAARRAAYLERLRG